MQFRPLQPALSKCLPLKNYIHRSTVPIGAVFLCIFISEVMTLNQNSLNNLITPEELNARLTPEERKKNAIKSGKASGASRNFRSRLKKHLKENPELFDELIDMLVSKSLDGDLKALEILLEYIGESPKQMEIKLKERELKLKEKNFENNNW